MKQILVYSDSLSWGIIPTTRQRLAFDERWPGILENTLTEKNYPLRVIENCLNGRRTVWDDPFKQGRNGLTGLEQVVEMHTPLALVVLMLGTNDFQSMHNHNAWHSAQGLGTLIDTIQHAAIEPCYQHPKVLMVIPPLPQQAKANMREKFEGAENKASGLSEQYQRVAKEKNCGCFDANQHITTSKLDGIHLDKDQHEVLAKALANFIMSDSKLLELLT